MFQRAKATIQFIRVIDKLFDLLNSQSPRGTGYKVPLRIINRCIKEDTIDSSIKCLAGLKDANGLSLLQHRRKTFVSGLILISTTTKMPCWLEGCKWIIITSTSAKKIRFWIDSYIYYY